MTVNQLDAVEAPDRVDQLFKLALWAFVASIGFSVAGMLLLKLFPSLMSVFGPVFSTLVKAPTWTYMTMLPVLSVLMYVRAHGWALMAFFLLWGSLAGGMSELIGTTTGLPFGPYQYTDWLGPKLLDHVPYFIPLSWFAMSIISLDLARRVTTRRYERIAVAAVFMVLWDVSLDPAMSSAFPFWIYPEGGFFYGMPASNWAGWLVVSVVIVWGYEAIGGGLRTGSRWAPLLYVLNCLFPLMISLLSGLYAAFVIGLIATALPVLAVYAREGLPDLRAR
jgi:carotene biosynthesis associated membrane protein